MTWIALIGSCVAFGASGCSMCCTPHYDMYPAYGGAWERTDRTSGRVGSVVEPAGTRVVGAPQDLEEAEEVAPPSEQPDETVPELPEEDESLRPLPEDLRPADPPLPLEARRR